VGIESDFAQQIFGLALPARRLTGQRERNGKSHTRSREKDVKRFHSTQAIPERVLTASMSKPHPMGDIEGNGDDGINREGMVAAHDGDDRHREAGVGHAHEGSQETHEKNQQQHTVSATGKTRPATTSQPPNTTIKPRRKTEHRLSSRPAAIPAPETAQAAKKCRRVTSRIFLPACCSGP
jgi:hypothetical protein